MWGRGVSVGGWEGLVWRYSVFSAKPLETKTKKNFKKFFLGVSLKVSGKVTVLAHILLFQFTEKWKKGSHYSTIFKMHLFRQQLSQCMAIYF